MTIATGSKAQILIYQDDLAASTAQKLNNVTFGESVGANKAVLNSNAITDVRGRAYARPDITVVNGQLTTEVSNDGLALLLKTVMGGMVKVGSGPYDYTFKRADSATRLKKLAIEKGFKDLGEYFLFTGMLNNSMDINITPQGLVTASFGFLGTSVANAQSSVGPVSPVSIAHVPFAGFDNIISVDGVQVKCDSFSLKFNNNGEQAAAIGYDSFVETVEGLGEATGSIGFYFEDLTQITKALDGDEVEIIVAADFGGKTFTLTIPKAIFTGPVVPNVSSPGLSKYTLNFTAVVDPVSQTDVQIDVTGYTHNIS